MRILAYLRPSLPLHSVLVVRRFLRLSALLEPLFTFRLSPLEPRQVPGTVQGKITSGRNGNAVIAGEPGVTASRTGKRSDGGQDRDYRCRWQLHMEQRWVV